MSSHPPAIIMGAELSAMIKSLDGGGAAEQEAKDALNSLYELGRSRNDAAWAQATSNAIKVYAPISQILLRRQSITASCATRTEGGDQGNQGFRWKADLGPNPGRVRLSSVGDSNQTWRQAWPTSSIASSLSS
ncbi:hypothetical protein B0T25DRAFT_98373 [Lasiosphaeria hispida]|uniref:Uncharacterized protein n=1 Tax=Lasiosphaeria hispida TaxID=260671 RepID=A0AAJ0MHM4_9PEZI|nr:hypothetical protein B0T25DRAFT_98373 [Lasiosphaeria hispida]